MSSAPERAAGGTTIEPPEPDLTPDELIARAVALRPELIAHAEETEENSYPSPALQEKLVEAGFYRCYVPRRYGGYEFDVPTFMRMTLELARGDASTGWCVALAGGHALQIGSWFGERAQAEIFGDGDFRAASVAAPLTELAQRTDDGWLLNGKVSYCSGIPYSTHYMGQTLTPGERPDGPPGPMLLFVAPRSEWRMLDDWGDLLGMKGSGSHSIVFEDGHIPSYFGLENTLMVDVDPSDGTEGFRLHGNPMFLGRALSCFTMTLGAVMVGAAYAALDDYERQMRTKLTPLPPMVKRQDDPDYQRYFGEAIARIATAEAALMNCADQHMQLCRRAAEQGIPYSYGDDMRLGCIARETVLQAWEIMQGGIFRTAGSSAGKRGERIERVFRDMAIGGNSHRNTLLRDWAFRELARDHLGLPRNLEVRNVQSPQSQGRRVPAVGA